MQHLVVDISLWYYIPNERTHFVSWNNFEHIILLRKIINLYVLYLYTMTMR